MAAQDRLWLHAQLWCYDCYTAESQKENRE